jgi:hypothetical protein
MIQVKKYGKQRVNGMLDSRTTKLALVYNSYIRRKLKNADVDENIS